jgi:NAD(P)-dependent dehydrogenase (short-subunit alcohol dehydrogenase family)
LVGRDPDRCRSAVERIRGESGNPQIEFMVADLFSMEEIRRLAAEFKTRHPRLDVLINNAGGIFFRPETSVDGIEKTFALNHLAYFLLTNLLLETLKASAPSRIVVVSSAAHLGARIELDNLSLWGWKGYCRSKLANLLFTYELARRLERTGVSVNALHPGLVASEFGANNGGIYRVIRPLISCFGMHVERGARTSVYLAATQEEVSGKYFVSQKEERSSPASYDRGAARQLWDVSARITGIAS